MNSTGKKLISIVIPVYNEELNIKSCYEQISAVASKLSQYRFEFIFTDNMSTDNSYAILEKLTEKDFRVRAYRLSKNFGYQRSILSGYLQAKGSAAIAIDCDLQDPPELMEIFLKNWELGYRVVYGVREQRNENILVKGVRKLFYRLIDFLCEYHIPLDAGDYRLIDRNVIQMLKNINDESFYLRGVIAGFGLSQIGILYHRANRRAGESKFKLGSMIRMAFNAIIDQSIVPLRIASFLGLTSALLISITFIVYTALHYFAGKAWPYHFTTPLILIAISATLNALFLGIIGEYLARIYKQTRKRPLAIIADATDKPIFNPRIEWGESDFQLRQNSDCEITMASKV